MYRKAFPKCEVTGSLEPVEFNHGGSTKHIPRKCYECSNLFEGECTRAMEQVQGYLSLDYGACRESGDCKPVLVEDDFIRSKVYVPAKCVRCRFLEYHANFGFRCHEDAELWGCYGKALDWGHWSPELPNIGLESGHQISMDLLQSVQEKNEVEAIKIFRSLN
ncbi:MAG: hypothetical protein P1V19_22615, partial [Gimesia sp.]|nr:hypothetical protein [Gimesia sp.]